MRKENAYYGSEVIARFLPTVSALRYLSCCRTAGWHECNRSYHPRIGKGVPVVLVIFTVRGAGWIKAGDRFWELSEGDFAIVPSNTPMEYATSSKNDNDVWEFYWLNLDGDIVQEMAGKLWDDGHAVHRCSNISTYKKIFRGLLETEDPEETRELEQSLKIQALFHELTSEILYEKNRLSSSSDSIYENILHYIQTNYAQKMSLEEFSRRFFLSKNQIIRIFKKRTGYAPYEYIKLYRLMKACELLQGTKYSVSEVGKRVGYCNCSHFIAQFREAYGMTPVEYRNMVSAE